MESQLERPRQFGIVAPIIAATVSIFAILTVLAGLPPADRLGGFVFGIIVLIAFTVGIGLLGWHLLVRPLPGNLTVTRQALISARARSIIALLLTLGTLNIGIAGVWDEIWHSKYGIPFGEDFFWRPHLMLYFGFSTLIGIGIWSWWVILNRGKGTLQQRFRMSPILGVSFLAGIFTIYSIVADPLWHKLYGSDIAPWSLPHLLILVMILLMGLLAIAFHKSLMAQRDWRVGFNIKWRDVLIALVLVGVLLDFMLIFTIQWYAAATGARQMTQVLAYPDWLLAVFITFLATLVGGIALHSTRQIGSATLVGVFTFAVRYLLDHGIVGVRDGTTPLILIIPVLLTLDILYAVVIKRTGKPPAFWLTAGIVGLVFGIVEYPLVVAVFPFLTGGVMTIPARIVASVLTASGTLWLAHILGTVSGFGESEVSPSAASAAEPPTVSIWTNTLLYGLFAIFIVFFIVTATPPVK
jgi:hypothetical protein